MQDSKGLDKKQLINFALLSMVLFGFMLYFMGPKDENKTKNTAAAVAKPTQPIPSAAVLPAGTVGAPVLLENQDLRIEITPKGGEVSYVELKKFKAYNKKTDQDDLPLQLFDRTNSQFGLTLNLNGKIIDSRGLLFTVVQASPTLVKLSAPSDAGTINFTYELKGNDLKFLVESPGAVSEVKWEYKVRQMEKGQSQEQSHSEFAYSLNNLKTFDTDARSELSEVEDKTDWLAIKQQFFTAILAPDAGFKKMTGNQEIIEKDIYLKKFNVNAELADSNSKNSAGLQTAGFTWHFLPLDLPLLKSYNKNYDEILPLGWSFIGGMNRHLLIPLYNFLTSFAIPAGWIIFLMTIVIKIVLSPIMYKQHKLSAMMKVIRPEIDEVNAKYKDADPMKKQKEVMAVYRKAGVNQLAGCLPSLIQIPIFYALFRFFPNLLDLRGKQFWFAKDLTAYDDVIKLPFTIPFLGDHLSIFAIACTIVILIYTMLTAGNIQQPTQEGMPNMKVLMYIFPITFLFFLNTASSGLSWYYFVSNAINILIILVIKYWILDEKKIHAQIQMNKEKPKKEGKFQQKMREMMEKAQEQQKINEKSKGLPPKPKK